MRPGRRLVGAAWVAAAIAAAAWAPGGVALPAAAAWGVLVALAAAVVGLQGRAGPPDLELQHPPTWVAGREGRLGARLNWRGPGRIRATVRPLAGPRVEVLPPAVELDLLPGEVRFLAFRVRPLARGPLDLHAIEVRSTDRFDLLERRRSWRLRPARVHPSQAAAGGIRARGLAGAGARSRRRAPTGTVSAALRPWQPGDDPRSIHWRATARLGRPVVRLKEEEEATRIVVGLPCGRNSALEALPGISRLDLGIQAALAILQAAADEGRRAGLVAWHRRLEIAWLPPSPRARPPARIWSDLAPWADQEEDPVEALRALRDRLRRRSRIAIVTAVPPEGDPALEEAVRLVLPRHEVVVAALPEPDLASLVRRGPPADLEALHLEAAALTLLEGRRRALARLARVGCHVHDLGRAPLDPRLARRIVRMRLRADRRGAGARRAGPRGAAPVPSRPPAVGGGVRRWPR